MAEQLSSPEKEVAVVQARLSEMVESFVQGESGRGGQEPGGELKHLLREAVLQELRARKAAPRGQLWENIIVRDEIVVEPGIINETGWRRDVKLANVKKDGKAVSEFVGALPPSLAEVEAGDRVIIVALGKEMVVPSWSKKADTEMYLLAKRYPKEDK